MSEESDVNRSNVIKMASRKPKADPTPEEPELLKLEELDEAGYFQQRMRRHRHLRKICKTLR